MLILDIVFRIVHILTAIVLLGGAIYLRCVVTPAAAELPESEQEALRARLRARWKKIVAICVGLLLLSGFYNYLQVQAPSHQGQPKYHMVLGIKILLGLVVVFISQALLGRAAAFEGMRRNAPRWLSILIVLGVIVVSIGSALKIAMPGTGVVPAVVAPPVETPVSAVR